MQTAAERNQFERTEVVKIVQSVINKMGDATDKSKETVLEELVHLARVIEETRAEISSIGANNIKAQQVASATDELDAVVSATKDATMTIMDACEEIQNAATDLPADKSQHIVNGVTKIFEACTFQDITGQRISKVVKLLKEIEGKVDQLLGVLGHHVADKTATVQADTRAGDEALLNGPQLAGAALSQEEIDKLLNDF